jgi:hypothetical protein
VRGKTKTKCFQKRFARPHRCEGLAFSRGEACDAKNHDPVEDRDPNAHIRTRKLQADRLRDWSLPWLDPRHYSFSQFAPRRLQSRTSTRGPRKTARELIAEADRPTRCDPRFGRKCLVGVLQKSIDLPSAVRSFVAAENPKTMRQQQGNRLEYEKSKLGPMAFSTASTL